MTVVIDDDVAAGSLPRIWLETASSVLPDVARDIVDRIRAEVPEYAVDRDGLVTAETRHAVRAALSMFMTSMANGTLDAGGAGIAPGDHGAEVFRRLGRREARAGRSHDTLQSAYRVASQSVMQQLLRWERDHGAPTDVMASLSTSVFTFIAELARYSAEGYGEARTAQADTEQLRSELVALLVAREGFSRRAVADAAARIEWTLPKTVTVVELVTDDDRSSWPHVFGSALTGRVGDRCLAVLSGPVDLAALRDRVAAVAGLLLVVGPTVPLVETASSARLAQRLRSRHDVRDRARDGVVACNDHLIDLMLDCGRDVGRALASARLQPLIALSPAKRIKYARLLSAWLERGTLNADVPGVLDKPRQTLRYQRQRLEAMFGEALHDRDARFELMLALRAELPGWERQAENYPNSPRRKDTGKA